MCTCLPKYIINVVYLKIMQFYLGTEKIETCYLRWEILYEQFSLACTCQVSPTGVWGDKAFAQIYMIYDQFPDLCIDIKQRKWRPSGDPLLLQLCPLALVHMLVWLPVPPQALCKHSRICFKTAQRSRTTKSATDVYTAAPAAALNRKWPWPEQLNSWSNVAVNIFCLGNMRKATLISSQFIY